MSLIFRKFYIYVLFIAIIICIGSCFAKKNMENTSFAFKGNVLGEVSFKYLLEKDTSFVFRFRVYDFTGIKLGDFLINHDSLKINYLIDKTYYEGVLGFFKANNPKFCFYELINEIYNGNLFIRNTNNYNCFLKEIVDSSRNFVKLELMTRKYEKFATIEASNFKNTIPSDLVLTMLNRSIFNISIVKK